MIYLLSLVFESGLDLDVERQTWVFSRISALNPHAPRQLVSAQLMLYLPLSMFRRCVADHRGEHKVKDFSCRNQFFAMAFAQLTDRESLRDIEVSLRAQARQLYQMGFRRHCGDEKRRHLCLPTGAAWRQSIQLRASRRLIGRAASAIPD